MDRKIVEWIVKDRSDRISIRGNYNKRVNYSHDRMEMYMCTCGGRIDHCLVDACNRDWCKDRKDYLDPCRDREISIIGMSLEFFLIYHRIVLEVFILQREESFIFKAKKIFKIKSNSS